MKREGRQHAHCSNRTSSSYSSSPPADLEILRAGDLEPASPWKHAGRCKRARCRSCHPHPVSKSKDKAKGARKLRACDVSLNHRLVSWRVVDGDGDGTRCYSSLSASGIVGYLSGFNHEEEEEEEEEGAEDEGEREAMVEEGAEFGGGPIVETCDVGEGGGAEVVGIAIENDDDMGFCQVGILWEYVDEEDWCVVGEM